MRRRGRASGVICNAWVVLVWHAYLPTCLPTLLAYLLICLPGLFHLVPGGMDERVK